MNKNKTYIVIFLIFAGIISIISYWDSIQDATRKIITIPESPLDLDEIEQEIAKISNAPCEHQKYTTIKNSIDGLLNRGKIAPELATDLNTRLYNTFATKIKGEARQSLLGSLQEADRIKRCLNEIGASDYASNDNDFNFYIGQFKAIETYERIVRNYTNKIINNGELHDVDSFFISSKYEEAVATINDLRGISSEFHSNNLVEEARKECLNKIEAEK
jgi:hypothetical protein